MQMTNEFRLLKDNFGTGILFFVVFIYPLLVIPGPLPYFYGPRYIVLSILFLLSLLHVMKEGIKLPKTVGYSLAAFLLFMTISTFASNDVATAWGGHGLRFTGASTYFFCSALFLLATKSSRSIAKVIHMMVISAILVSITAILQFYEIQVVPHEVFREGFRSFGTMGNPNFLGTYTVFILPASIMLFLYEKRSLWLVGSCIIFAALSCSLTRGAWIAAGFALAVIFIYALKHLKYLKRYIIVLILFSLVFLILNNSNNQQLKERLMTIPTAVSEASEYTETSSSSIRIFVWKETIGVIKNHWMFGVGPDNLQIQVPNGTTEDKALNIFLEIASTMGLFALASYLVLIVNCIKFKKESPSINTMLSLMIITYLIQGQFNIDVIPVLPLFWIVIGLSVSGEINTESINREAIIIKPKWNNAKYNSYYFASMLTLFTLLCIIALLIIIPRNIEIVIDGHGKYMGQARGINTFHGYGEMYMESGVIYKGDFKNGLFDGEGILMYPNGSYYEGSFKQSFFHGAGKMVNDEGGITIEGEWYKGKVILPVE